MGRKKQKSLTKTEREDRRDTNNLKISINKAEKWARYYMEKDGLTYEQAMLKAWNNDKYNKCGKHYGL